MDGCKPIDVFLKTEQIAWWFWCSGLRVFERQFEMVFITRFKMVINVENVAIIGQMLDHEKMN